MKCPKCNGEVKVVDERYHKRHIDVCMIGGWGKTKNEEGWCWTDFYYCPTCDKGFRVWNQARMEVK